MTSNHCNLYIYVYCIFEIQMVKLFIVSEMTFKGHSMSLAMSSFIRSPGLYIRDQKK